LATLEAEDLVKRDPDTRKYRLGVKLLEWGAGAQSQMGLHKIAGPVMQKLSDELDCTVQLTVVVQQELLPIESIESKTGTGNPSNTPASLDKHHRFTVRRQERSHWPSWKRRSGSG
ncbi:MAG TPA: hypothetical protein VMX75_09550, partial [Spirochaetia bacterium]|nr:hypothetical protein [Spirochaetia bacterium]